MKMERMQIEAFVASIWQHQAQKMACKHNKMADAGSDNLPCMGKGAGGVAAAVGKYCHRFFRQKRINRWYLQNPLEEEVSPARREGVGGWGRGTGNVHEIHWTNKPGASWFLINYKSALWPRQWQRGRDRDEERVRETERGHFLLLFDFWQLLTPSTCSGITKRKMAVLLMHMCVCVCVCIVDWHAMITLRFVNRRSCCY